MFMETFQIISFFVFANKVLNISLSPRTDWRMPSDANYRRRL